MLALSRATADALAESAGAFESGCSGVLHFAHVTFCGLEGSLGYLLKADT